MSRVDQTGSKNPNWKGGHKFWIEGHKGRDKDGLSWKVQQRLCWERDDYTCQGCGRKGLGWRPDVHHISPYRISFSHDQENLICLCRSCHKVAESYCKELWGGRKFGGGPRPDNTERCSLCRKPRKTTEGICRPCYRVTIQVPLADSLRSTGHSYEDIARRLRVNKQTAWNMVNRARTYSDTDSFRSFPADQ